MAVRQATVLIVSAAALVAAAGASLTLGAVHVPLHDVIDALTGGGGTGATDLSGVLGDAAF